MANVTAVQEYAVLHAIVRARYSTMLTAATWETLCHARDCNALLSMLAETVYAPYLQIDREELTPRRAVYQIKKHLADTYNTIIQSTPESRQHLVLQLWRLYEIDNLKAILRGIATGATWEQVRYVLFPLSYFTVLRPEELLRTGNVNAAVELLRGTPYYESLSYALERYTTERSLFPLEVALDLDYLRALWDDVNRLSGEDYQQAMRIIGTQIDVTNLLWAMRYRVYHHLSEEEIINYTVPFGYKVRDEDIRTIAAGGDMTQVITRCYPDLPDVRSLLREPQRGLPELEIQLQRYVAKQCQTTFVGYPFHLGIPLAYLLLSEFEIQDLTVLIEAKAAGMPAEVFKPHLVLG